ncbi:MAG: metallophosphoesterase [Pseudomonadota bacterium]
MKSKYLFGAVLLAAGLANAQADEGRENSENGLAIAVFGDAPYSCKTEECPPGYFADSPDGPNPRDHRQIDATPAFIDSVNKDPKVRLVLFAGDIHSGANYCTQEYNQTIFDLWTQFKDPLVYTPGDNEWSDCQKSKEGGGVKNSAGEYVDYAAGHPAANLALVRSMFFSEPGQTLGGGHKHVTSQAQGFDPAHPSDAEYVENVMWMESGVVFVTMNIPGGSNNDDDLWNTGAFGAVRSAPQIQDVAKRTQADLRWLNSAFTMAKLNHAKAVVIMEQADMWDLDGTGPALTHIANYEPFIAKIESLTRDFKNPVLLINGDSHRYRSDNPLTDNAACVVETGVGAATKPCDSNDDNYDTHPYYPAGLANFHRLVIHGSTFPLEYTRLSVNPRAAYPASDKAFGPFSWERVIP